MINNSAEQHYKIRKGRLRQELKQLELKKCVTSLILHGDWDSLHFQKHTHQLLAILCY